MYYRSKTPFSRDRFDPPGPLTAKHAALVRKDIKWAINKYVALTMQSYRDISAGYSGPWIKAAAGSYAYRSRSPEKQDRAAINDEIVRRAAASPYVDSRIISYLIRRIRQANYEGFRYYRFGSARGVFRSPKMTTATMDRLIKSELKVREPSGLDFAISNRGRVLDYLHIVSWGPEHLLQILRAKHIDLFEKLKCVQSPKADITIAAEAVSSDNPTLHLAGLRLLEKLEPARAVDLMVLDPRATIRLIAAKDYWDTLDDAQKELLKADRSSKVRNAITSRLFTEFLTRD